MPPIHFTNTTDPPTEIDDDQSEVILGEECLLSIIETLELVTDANSESISERQQLLCSLQKLAAILTTDLSSTEIMSTASILEMENFFVLLRTQLAHYTTVEIPRIRSTLLEVLQAPKATLLVRSLVSHCCCWQLLRERDSVEKVVSHLDTLYNFILVSDYLPTPENEVSSPLPLMVADLIACLQRKELLANPDVIMALRLFSRNYSRNAAKTKQTPQPPTTQSLQKQLIPQCDSAVQAATLLDAVQEFVSAHTSQLHVTILCLVGPEGKTHNCNQVVQMLPSTIRLLNPLDLLGSTRSSHVAVILDKFQQLSQSNPGILVMDDIHLCTKDQLSCISQCLEWLKMLSAKSSLVILTCPDPSMLSGWGIAPDRVIQLGLPNAEERSELLSSIWKQPIPMDLVEATSGKSRTEIQQLSRHVLSNDHDNPLLQLRNRLASATPESLKKGIVDDSLDWHVWGADELDQQDHGPMRGASAAKAWTRLQTNLLIPLTRAEELSQIMGLTAESTPTLGALITGDSGSGKTTLARRCAHFAKCPLLVVSCPALLRQEVGGSETALTRLLEAARRASPCLLLLEHLEAIASVRGNDMTTEGTMDRLLSTLLVELDGVQEKSSGPIAVVGTTIDPRWIDPSLLRPGRLEHVVELDRDWD